MSSMQNMPGQQNSSYQQSSTQNYMHSGTSYPNQQPMQNYQQQTPIPAQYSQNKQIYPQMVNNNANGNANTDPNLNRDQNSIPVPYIVFSQLRIDYF